jgi:ATP-binding cassette subfamily B protein/subfamily B ATP-binding cassette protein MsbA
LFFVFRHARRYARELLLTVLSMFLLVATQLAGPYLIRTMISIATEPAAMGLVTRQEAVDSIARLAAVALGLYSLQAILRFVRRYVSQVAGWNVVADIRRQVYEHLQLLSLRFYEDTQTGQLMSRAINDTGLINHLIAHGVPSIIVNGLMLTGVLIVLASLNWRLALLSLVPIPLIALSMRFYYSHFLPAFRERQAKLGELNAVLQDNLSGIREIKAFTRETTESERVFERIAGYRDAGLRALRILATFHPLVSFGSSLGSVVLIYFGGQLVLDQTLPVADLVAYFLYLSLLYQPVRALSHAIEDVNYALTGAERVAALLEQEPHVAEREDAAPLPGRASGALAFRDVSFHYVEDEMVLEHIDLEVPAGQVVALVGPTGVGKTTMANLIPRFYDVTAGSITLDGQDIRELTLRSLRQQISIVLQNVFLFHGTVRENILFGRLGATEQEMIAGAKVANAHEFISEMPDGYDTMIGERGVKLSGGQRQRIAIARAVLKDAPILILDEATSSVDTETELLIQEALERLMVGRTTIVIAHRLSTIRSADNIVVLQGNRIVEMGAHEQLMARGGLYRRLSGVQVDDEPRW